MFKYVSVKFDLTSCELSNGNSDSSKVAGLLWRLNEMPVQRQSSSLAHTKCSMTLAIGNKVYYGILVVPPLEI